MATQKITISLNPEVLSGFKELKIQKGFSISAWVNLKMQAEIDKNHDLKIVVKILRKEYSNFTENVSDKQILNDIVTIFMARDFDRPTLEAMYYDLDNLPNP